MAAAWKIGLRTVYYEPETQQEFDELMDIVKVGDMVYSKWVFSGLWYTVGLNDINDPTTICLFPNIIMEEALPPLTRWGMARYDYLKENKRFLAAQFGTVGLQISYARMIQSPTKKKSGKSPNTRLSRFFSFCQNG